MESLPPAVGPRVALAPARYARHRPEATLLYELVEQHYPAFLATLERDGRSLPTFVQHHQLAPDPEGRTEAVLIS